MRFLTLSLLLVAQQTFASLTPLEQHPIYDSASSSTSSLLKLHRSLVEHESITGNEHDVAEYLVSYLSDKDFTVETQRVDPYNGSKKQRLNVFAYIGNQRRTRTLISSHIDTVPPFWPYKRKGDEIWGRGSVDAKASVATQVTAVEELRAAGKLGEGDIALLFVVGEEVGGDGMKKVNELGLAWETVIFGEPTELKLASGHKGSMTFDIVAKGKAGHSGYPELGKSANAMLIPALNLLLNAKLPYNEKYGNTTLNIGEMEGGVAANVIAENARAKVMIRIADGSVTTIEKIVLDTLQGADEELEVTFKGGYGPVYIDSDVPGKSQRLINLDHLTQDF